MSCYSCNSPAASDASLVESWIAFDSQDNSSAPTSATQLYKPIRINTRSRKRPALPPSFLEIDGDHAKPWKQHREDSSKKDKLSVEDVFAAVHLTVPSRPPSIQISSAALTPSDVRFSTPFGTSQASLLATENSPIYAKFLAGQAGITGDVQIAQPGYRETAVRKTALQFRKGNLVPLQLAGEQLQDDILHIRLHSPLSPSQSASKRQETSPASKRAQKNMKILAENPNAKDAATTIDGIFGIGKEESKARRGGYAGLGIAKDKKSWKSTEDYVGLLAAGTRSSIYNYANRSPRSRRHSTAPRSPVGTKSPRRPPPPPLNLTSLSSHVKIEVKEVKKVPEIQKDSSKPTMLKGILRSVRSLSNLRKASA